MLKWYNTTISVLVDRGIANATIEAIRKEYKRVTTEREQAATTATYQAFLVPSAANKTTATPPQVAQALAMAKKSNSKKRRKTRC